MEQRRKKTRMEIASLGSSQNGCWKGHGQWYLCIIKSSIRCSSSWDQSPKIKRIKDTPGSTVVDKQDIWTPEQTILKCDFRFSEPVAKQQVKVFMISRKAEHSKFWICDRRRLLCFNSLTNITYADLGPNQPVYKSGVHIWLNKLPSAIWYCFQCFYTVGWASGKTSGPYKLSSEVLAQLTVWSEVRLFAHGPANATAIQNHTISCIIKMQTGFVFQVPANDPSCNGKQAIRVVCGKTYTSKNVCLLKNKTAESIDIPLHQHVQGQEAVHMLTRQCRMWWTHRSQWGHSTSRQHRQTDEQSVLVQETVHRIPAQTSATSC